MSEQVAVLSNAGLERLRMVINTKERYLEIIEEEYLTDEEWLRFTEGYGT